MNGYSIVLIGGPGSGKTNYMARLWEALSSRQGALRAPNTPPDIKYVEDALAHLLQGTFAPRSDKNLEQGHNFSVPVTMKSGDENAPIFEIVVPDVSGELWKKAVQTCELPQQWMDQLAKASGALLFVCINSEHNVQPLDWVNTAALLRTPLGEQAPQEEPSREIPTQVALCELVRFLELGLGTAAGSNRPRIAVVVTAWDRLDAETAREGPRAYLARQFPLLAGRLADVERFDVKIFGVSVVGGDFVDEDFKQKFLEGKLKDSGCVVYDGNEAVEVAKDLTLPVAWLVANEGG